MKANCGHCGVELERIDYREPVPPGSTIYPGRTPLCKACKKIADKAYPITEK